MGNGLNIQDCSGHQKFVKHRKLPYLNNSQAIKNVFGSEKKQKNQLESIILHRQHIISASVSAQQLNSQENSLGSGTVQSDEHQQQSPRDEQKLQSPREQYDEQPQSEEYYQQPQSSCKGQLFQSRYFSPVRQESDLQSSYTNEFTSRHRQHYFKLKGCRHDAKLQ